MHIKGLKGFEGEEVRNIYLDHFMQHPSLNVRLANGLIKVSTVVKNFKLLGDLGELAGKKFKGVKLVKGSSLKGYSHTLKISAGNHVVEIILKDIHSFEVKTRLLVI